MYWTVCSYLYYFLQLLCIRYGSSSSSSTRYSAPTPSKDVYTLASEYTCPSFPTPDEVQQVPVVVVVVVVDIIVIYVIVVVVVVLIIIPYLPLPPQPLLFY